MLAAIPSRFSIDKPIISSSAAQPQPANGNAAVLSTTSGTAAIPSKRSREAPGLQPEVVACVAQGSRGTHVAGDAVVNGDMPR